MYGGLRNLSVCFDLLCKQRDHFYEPLCKHWKQVHFRRARMGCDVFASRTGSLINEIRSCRVEIVRNRTGASLVAFSG